MPLQTPLFRAPIYLVTILACVVGVLVGPGSADATSSSITAQQANAPKAAAPKGTARDAALAASAVAAAPPLDCTSVYALRGQTPHDIWTVDTATGSMTSVDQMSLGSSTSNNNGMGISADGRYIFTHRSPNVYRLDRDSGTVATYTGVSGLNATHGAVDPASGLYYFGNATTVYALDPATGALFSGAVANLSYQPARPGDNGDWAFDRLGNMYVVTGSATNSSVYVFTGLPRTDLSSAANLAGRRIATFTTNEAVNGVAFGGQGTLFAASGARIYEIHPTTGDGLGNQALATSGSVDLASCATPSSIVVRKNVADRAAAGDQFQVSVTGGEIDEGNTGTTTGTDTGLQTGATEIAGPVLGLPGTTYTIAEAGVSGADLDDYSITWACVDEGNGDAPVASGTGPSGEFTMPASVGGRGAAVVCTFTNAAVPAVRDFGDAPDSYGTTSGSSGPSHKLVDYDQAAHATELMLGDSVDAEDDGAPGATAEGDDSAGTDDENALAEEPTFEAGATTASLDVAVTNASGGAATLHGWIDADADGLFEAGEHASVPVPDGASSASLDWSGLPALVTGSTPHVRLRLSSGALSDDPATGVDERSRAAAPDGEVEDHRATVGSAVPEGCASPFVEDFGTGPNYGGPLSAGQTTYTHRSSGFVQDGSYTLASAIAPDQMGGWWHAGPDHTPGDVDGRLMLVNAAFEPGRFFQRTFRGLETGATYDFSAWATNALSNGNDGRILPNITFRVVDPRTDSVIAEIDSGEVPGTSAAEGLAWHRYDMQFVSPTRTVRLELVNNAPGGSGNDLAIDDISFNLACEFGDAPSSYGTLASDDGPVHALTGPVLGTARDGEGDGLPSVSADGDDTAGTDDEDGVSFNPALGYPNPTIRTGTDPVTLQPVSNTLEVTASDDGFASVWVDWNIDGDFADDGERVANAQPVTAGTNPVTFSRGPNPPDIRTYVRVRYSTDPAAIVQPTGPAPDGEVEDYRVLVERLIVPAACTPTDDAFYAMTFNRVGQRTGTGTVGSTTRYPDVTVVDGRPVDMVLEVYSGSTQSHPVNGMGITGDDYAFNRGSDPGLYHRFYEAGTSTPIAVSGVWTVNDMDDTEGTRWIPPSSLAGFALTPGSEVTVSTSNAAYTYFRGNRSGNADPWSRYQVWFQDRTEMQTVWGGFQNSGYAIDGDNDVAITPSCADYGDAPNSYATRETDNGPRHEVDPDLHLGAQVEFDGNGQPNVNASGDDTNRVDDEDGVASEIAMTVGEPTTVTIDVTNDTGDAATLAGWLDSDGDGVFEVGERVIVPVGAGTSSYPLVFPPGPETTTTAYARFRLFPGAVTNPSPTGPAAAGEVEDYPVAVLTRALEIEKTSTGTADSRPGDTVTYTITATNTGDGAFTEANPARVVDDLTAVLDDAAWNGDAAATVEGEPAGTVAFTPPRLHWAGPLAAGESVQITYTVALEPGGDGAVRNVAWAPPIGTPPGPTPDCNDPATTVPCTGHEFLLPKLRITKVASRNDLPAVGGEITYSVTVRNVGPGTFSAAEPATFTDDLTDVEDDADMVGSPSASSGTPTYTEPDLSWTGALAAGGQATVSYTFRYDASGNQSLVNSACVPETLAADPGDDCGRTTTPGSGLDQAKTASPASGTAVDAGDQVTYTLRFTNTGQTAATVDTVDDLAGVVDDADVLLDSINADGGLTATYDPTGRRLVITGAVPVGETLFVRYTVRVRGFGAQEDHVLRNALACQPGDAPTCDADTTEHPVRSLVVDKSSDATIDARPGDRVTYTVTAESVGPGDYTTEDPAIVLDVLTGVLDDADWNDDAVAEIGLTAVADPVFVEPRLRWSGALASGDTVTITYSVTLTGGGDGTVRNIAFAPGCEPTAPGCTVPVPECANGIDPATGLSCAPNEFMLPKLSIVKSVDADDVRAVGEEVTFTITVQNVGDGDYTATAPASFTDDLSDVLDDAELVPDSVTGGATVVGTDLRWSGPLPAGRDATIGYTVRYTGAGNRELVNSACVPDDEALVAATACGTTETPGSALVQAKSADPADGMSVEAGDEITYTLTFDNSAGRAPAIVDTVDDLSDVLDDAEVTQGPAAEGALTVDLPADSNELAVGGSVPAGETLEVTYTVTVLPYAEQGNHMLTNALACQPGETTTCEPEVTEHQVRHLRVSKTAAAPTAVDTGDEMTYTVIIRNDGAGAYTQADPASVVDHLSDVLDDATFDVNDVVVAGGGSISFDGAGLTWSGPLAAEDEVTLTYTVTVTNLGDHDLVNTVSGVRCDDADEGCAPPPVETLLPHVVASKTSDPAPGTDLGEGDEVTYTLSWHNDGRAVGVVDATDDLSGLLDDAKLIEGPTSSSDAVNVAVADGDLRVTGPIGVDETVTVTYRVRVLPDGERGDNVAGNVLTPDTPQVECDGDECEPVDPPTTEHLIGELDDWKTADPSNGRAVNSGDRLTYTLHFTNTGTAAVEVARNDLLTGVLDDALVVRRPTASDPTLAVSPIRDGRFAVTGTLAPDQRVTVSYTVRVKHASRQGDRMLANALIDPGQSPPKRCAEDDDDSTCHRVKRFDLVLGKRVVGSTRVTVGDTARYRIQVANRGPDAAPGPIRITDALPRGLELRSAHGKGWKCRVHKGTDTVTCVRDGALRADSTTAPVVVIAATTQAVAGQQIVNSAKIDGAGDTENRNDRDTAAVQVVKVPPPPSTGFRHRNVPEGTV